MGYNESENNKATAKKKKKVEEKPNPILSIKTFTEDGVIVLKSN